MAHCQPWEAKTKVGKKQRRHPNQSRNPSQARSAKSSRRPRQNRCGVHFCAIDTRSKKALHKRRAFCNCSRITRNWVPRVWRPAESKPSAPVILSEGGPERFRGPQKSELIFGAEFGGGVSDESAALKASETIRASALLRRECGPSGPGPRDSEHLHACIALRV